MTPEVRDRIEQIRHGNVPEGYKKTRSGIVPTEWTETCLGDIYTERKEPGNENLPLLMVSIHSGVSDGEVGEDDLPKKVKRIEDKSQYKRAAKGDLVFNMMRAWQGAIGTVRTEGMVSPAYIVAEPNSMVDPLFMDFYMKTNRMVHMIHKQSYGVTDFRLRLYWDSFAHIQCVLPSVKEQKKIAEILTTQDRVIELKEKRLAEKQRQKKYLMQQLLTGKKRLSGFDEEWETAPIGNFLESRNTKQMPSAEAPLMAFVSGEGVTSKGERYDRSHLVKEDIKKYKRTEVNDFIYSSNNLDVGSIGLNKYGTAVISIVYEIFKAKEKVVPVVISEIIQLPRNLHHILSYRQGAFYGQYRIFSEDFLSVPIKVPCYEEQLAIGVVLDAADREIDLLRQDLEQEKQKKKALMQLLLTGIVRV